MSLLNVPLSIGEVLDKISILRIKEKKIFDKKKLKEIKKELILLLDLCEKNLNNYEENILELEKVNEILWEIEDNIREKEKLKIFDNSFIELARKVYQTNDLRFKLKNEVNKKFNSEINEQKSYEEY